VKILVVIVFLDGIFDIFEHTFHPVFLNPVHFLGVDGFERRKDAEHDKH
jgi:hypothetical protein